MNFWDFFRGATRAVVCEGDSKQDTCKCQICKGLRLDNLKLKRDFGALWNVFLGWKLKRRRISSLENSFVDTNLARFVNCAIIFLKFHSSLINKLCCIICHPQNKIKKPFNRTKSHPRKVIHFMEFLLTQTKCQCPNQIELLVLFSEMLLNYSRISSYSSTRKQRKSHTS